MLEEGLRFKGAQWINTNSTSIGDGLFAGADRRWTVSCWAKSVVNESLAGVIVARAASATTSLRTFQMYFNTTANAQVVLRGSFADFDFPTDNVWRNITITWDGTKAFVYVNGVKPPIFFPSGQPDGELRVGTAEEETAEPILIGARTSATPALFMKDGNIAFTGIWDRALTPAEIETVKALTDPR